MNYPPHIWDQLKNRTAADLIAALIKDGWARDTSSGSQQIFRHKDGRRVSIHLHPAKTYGAKMLKGLLDDTGWTADDFRRLKLIK